MNQPALNLGMALLPDQFGMENVFEDQSACVSLLLECVAARVRKTTMKMVVALANVAGGLFDDYYFRIRSASLDHHFPFHPPWRKVDEYR